MANLDFIKNLLSKKQTQDYPIIPLVQVNEQGGLEADPLKMAQAELGLKQASTPLTVKDRLFGREMTQDYQTVNPDTNETEMTTISNYRPGFLNDFASGFRENTTENFNIQNLAPDENKGVATRLGEGLGSLVSLYNKPIGRGLLAGGAALALGGGGAEALAYGMGAGVGRQQYQTADKVYRSQLKQLGMTDEELNAIKGNVTKDIFEGVTSGMRLGNQRMTYGQLAMLDEEIAREVAANPALANQFVPVNFARDIYGKKRDTAEGAMAKIAAETKKTEKETALLGKPKPKTTIEYVTKSEGGGSDRPTQTDDAGVVRVQAPNGQTGTIPRARLREAIKAGYKVI